jgi:ribosomal protein S18 acetylase RimI-like enzyme
LEIRHLENTSLEDIVDCFNTAFADYLVPFQAEVEPMRKRWLSCRVDYRLSYGAFEGDELVGFMITGVDEWQGMRTAYNAGTGVIPAYRGQRLVQQLYDTAFPAFRAEGIGQCTLEVIVGNDRAIKAYERVGFKKVRTLKCYGKANFLPIREKRKWTFKETVRPNWAAYAPFQTFPPSWENTQRSVDIVGDDYSCWELYEAKVLIGYLLLRPQSAYVAQFGVADREDWLQIGQQLWQHALRIHSGMRINNVQAEARRLIAILELAGLQNTVDQYEMSLRLDGVR